MNNFIDLQLCPFCGGEADVVVEDGKYGVECSRCSGMIAPELDTIYDAVVAWNKRS